MRRALHPRGDHRRPGHRPFAPEQVLADGVIGVMPLGVEGVEPRGEARAVRRLVAEIAAVHHLLAVQARRAEEARAEGERPEPERNPELVDLRRRRSDRVRTAPNGRASPRPPRPARATAQAATASTARSAASRRRRQVCLPDETRDPIAAFGLVRCSCARTQLPFSPTTERSVPGTAGKAQKSDCSSKYSHDWHLHEPQGRRVARADGARGHILQDTRSRRFETRQSNPSRTRRQQRVPSTL